MAEERLSKLQKWILTRCLENKTWGITRDEVREFFGKKLPPKRHLSEAMNEDINGKKGEKFNWNGRYYTPKKELVSTRSIEASISRSFGNLMKRELLTEKHHFGQHYLTETGFLKANKKENSKIDNTYEDYIRAINKANEEMKKHYQKLTGDLKNILTKRHQKGDKN